ncbi:MAG: histidine kinase N-terminal 7TM domain-containing protein [Candidatus Latescibacteria bacterium]|nr:histidine kinase N-terminal 7TM domain-containing protein [Candidatus Latescibacterota bacterium]
MAYSFLTFSVIPWTTWTALSLYQTDLNMLVFISNIQRLSSVIIAPAWMIFAVGYTRHDHGYPERRWACSA